MASHCPFLASAPQPESRRRKRLEPRESGEAGSSGRCVGAAGWRPVGPGGSPPRAGRPGGGAGPAGRCAFAGGAASLVVLRRRVLSRAPAPVPVRPRAGDAVGPPGARRSGGSPGRSGSRWDSEFLVSHAPNGLSSESWVSKQTCKKSGNCVNNRHPISAAVGNAVIKTLNVLKFKVENAEIS